MDHLTDYSLRALTPVAKREKLLARRRLSPPGYLLFWGLHVPFGLWIVTFPQLATFHALVTLLVGIWFVVTKAPLERIVYVGAYIVGAEVFWRAAGANVFWEYGKYATVLIFVLASLRLRPLRIPRSILMYFLLLLPAIIPTIGQLPISDAREQISFNLSGHLALFVVTVFFSNSNFSKEMIRNMLIVFISPILTMATLALHSVLTSEITWSLQSNFAASGGFGPNQVSTALSSGALAALLLLWLYDLSAIRRLVLIGIALWFAGLSLLTFSRGGVAILVGAMAGIALSVLLDRSQTQRLRMVVTVSFFALVISLWLYPQLNDFTGGKLALRFSDTSLTGRDRIAQASWQVFKEHPLTGVGVGLAPEYIAPLYGQRAAAHTEFSRLLAEHGLIGILSLSLFANAYLSGLRKVLKVPVWRHISLAWFVWSVGYMLGNAMRTVAPSFFLGLTFVGLPEADTQETARDF